MAQSQFVTLCLHTPPHARIVKELLESHGLSVTASPVHIPGADTQVVCLQVDARHLEAALKVTESGAHESPAWIERKLAGATPAVLVPVDFTPASMEACRLGFQLARRLSLKIVLLHATTAPYFTDAPIGDDMGLDDMELPDIEQMELTRETQSIATRKMNALRTKLQQEAAAGNIPDINFTTRIEEGIPEDVILNYTRNTPPALVVMASRGRDRSHTDSLGSITAEVIDRCRVPLFTVPDNITFNDIAQVTKIAFLCTLTRHDILSVESLMRIFDYPQVEMWLVAAHEAKNNNAPAEIKAFASYLAETYPESVFHTPDDCTTDPRQCVSSLVAEKGVELVIVPNRKTNLFERLFKPGMAHRIFFEGDVPLLVLPV